jgi:hypothetical protein
VFLFRGYGISPLNLGIRESLPTIWTRKFDGVLQDVSGQPLVIQGIWSLGPGDVSPSSLDPDDAPLAQVYFTAGPNEETAGLFGYLTAVPTELTQGSDH